MMPRRAVAHRFLAASLAALTASPLYAEALTAHANAPLQLGSRLELFVDDYLVDTMTGLRLELHAPVPAGRAITFDRPWEGTTSGVAVVFKDADLYSLQFR